MITLEQLQEMLTLQEMLEVHISGPQWREQGHNYPLCVHMECAEIIDKYGWKHWKKQDQDLPGIAMELVDVWHFCLAHWLQDNPDDAERLYDIIVGAGEEYDLKPPPQFIDACIGMSFCMFATNSIPMGNFIAMLAVAGMNFEELYRWYIAKNILNKFRQDNGYKTGEYIKNWCGTEDNEVLAEICKDLGTKLTATGLYDQLKLRYAAAYQRLRS